jgi:hypothetical protein
MREGRRR